MNFSFTSTLLILGGLTLLVGVLFLSTWRHRARSRQLLEDDPQLPDDFGPRLTSKRLRWVRWAFTLLVLASLGCHLYWGLFSTGPFGENEKFDSLKNRRDQRNRRELESMLRGWIYDRQHKPETALAKYRYLDRKVYRDYPLGQAAAHIIGYGTLLRGDVLLERAVVAPRESQQKKQWWEQLGELGSNEGLPAVGQDLVLTIDAELQREAFAQLEKLKDKAGAVVVLNPQTGAVLALVSAPSFDPYAISDNVKWAELQKDVRRKPLLNRALDEYYLPGSTFKTLTAAAALDNRRDDSTFTCRGGGWTPSGSTRAINDDEGHVHGALNLLEAYTVSCNQYFAQLGVEVGRQKLGEAASRFGLRVFNNPADSIGTGQMPNLWNTDNKVLSDVLAPLNSTFVAGDKITKYDLGLQSIGQGYVQLTVIEMAMMAAAVANAQGNVMRPLIEANRQPQVLHQAMSPTTAAKLRTLMATVVQRGTAAGAFGTAVRGRNLTAGGKTGTAQRTVPEIDPRTGKYRTYVDRAGRTRLKMAEKPRIDSWFIGFAPVENPQLAWAVMVEEGGYGSRIAAPIAGQLVLKAHNLGLLGVPPPTTPPAQAAPSPKTRRRPAR